MDQAQHHSRAAQSSSPHPLWTDAAVIAVAERLRITEVATLDHRHFRVVRPRHIPAFTLLP